MKWVLQRFMKNVDRSMGLLNDLNLYGYIQYQWKLDFVDIEKWIVFLFIYFSQWFLWALHKFCVFKIYELCITEVYEEC